MKITIFQDTAPWNYYLYNVITNEIYKVTEEEFFEVVGYNRSITPMQYDKKKKNRQNFYLENTIIGYRERKKQ